MKNKIALLLVACCFLSSNQMPPEEEPCFCDPRVMEVNKYSYFSLPANESSDIGNRITEYHTNLSRTQTAFLRKYRQAERAATFGKAIITANEKKWDIILASVPVKNPITDVGLKYANEKIHEVLEEAIEDGRKKTFRQYLYEVKQNDQAAYNKLVGNEEIVDGEAMKALLSGSDSYDFIKDQLISEGKASDVDILVMEMIEQRRRDIGKVSEQSYLRDVKLDTKITETGKRVISLEKRVKEFYDKQMRLNESLITQGQAIKESISGIQVTLNSHSQDLSFLKGVAFRGMTAAEQYEAVKNDVFKVQNKEAALREIERRKNIDAYLATTKQILKAGNDIVTILDNVGVDPKFVKKASTIVKAGSLIQQGVAAYLTGDPIGAFASLTSLFKLGKSPQDLQMERMQKTLNAIYKLNVQMDKKLDRLLEESRTTQQLIVQSTQSLHEAISSHHQIVLDELYNIHSEVRITQDLMHEYNVDNRLRSYWNEIGRLRSITDYDVIPSYERFHSDFNIGFNLSRLWNVNEALGEVFSTTEIANQRLVRVPDVIKFRSEVGSGPSVFFALISSLNSLKEANDTSEFISLLAPTKKIFDIREKLGFDFNDFVVGSAADKIKIYYDNEMRSALAGEAGFLRTQTLIDPNKLITYSAVLMNFIQMSNYLKMDGVRSYSQASIEEVRKMEPGVAHSYFDRYPLLWNAYDLTSIAISQQNLFSGDMILPYYADQIVSKEIFAEDRKADLRNAKLLMAKDHVFNRNLSILLFKDQLKKSGGSNLAYKQFFNQRDSISMKMLLNFENKAGGVVTRLRKNGFYWGFDKENLYQFPAPGELDLGIVQYPPIMGQLMDLREKLLEQIIYMHSMLDKTPTVISTKFRREYDHLIGESTLPPLFFIEYQNALTSLF